MFLVSIMFPELLYDFCVTPFDRTSLMFLYSNAIFASLSLWMIIIEEGNTLNLCTLKPYWLIYLIIHKKQLQD